MIKLTLVDPTSERPVFLNPASVVAVYAVESPPLRFTRIHASGLRFALEVTESPEEVLRALSAGKPVAIALPGAAEYAERSADSQPPPPMTRSTTATRKHR
jgi:hypothetical protein